MQFDEARGSIAATVGDDDTFTATCRSCTGTATCYRGLDDEAVWECVGGCREEEIVGAKVNGAIAHTNGLTKPDVYGWKAILYEYAKQACERAIKENADSREAIAAMPIEAFVALVEKVRNVPDTHLTHDPDLSATEIEEEVYAIATALQKLYARAVVIKPEDDPYLDRHAIDAYEAYTLSRSEPREDAVKGLIRIGCTGLLAALIGSGKSTLALNFARAWAIEGEILGRKCIKSRTLAVVSPKEYEAWIETIGFWELKESVFIIPSHKAHFGDPKLAAAWFVAEMEKWQCKTFVLDTLFDFFGMPPNNAGDQNRIVMTEQTPLLDAVREHKYAGLVTGHSPKTEAHAIDPRDPEEAFAGHTAWAAQHRMRITIRRKAAGCNAIITGRGGYGDDGILEERLLLFDPATRLDSLGGLFSQYMGEAAWPEVKAVMEALGQPVAMSMLIKEMNRSAKFVRPGVRFGRDKGFVEMEGKGKSTKYRLIDQNMAPSEEEF